MNSDNPYAPPTSETGDYQELTPPFEVRGHHLLVKSGAHLPMRCVKTNEDVAPRQLVSATYLWAPSFRFRPFSYRCQLSYYVSKAKQKELGRRRTVGALFVAAGVAVLALRLLPNIPNAAGLLLILGFAVLATATKYSHLRVVRKRNEQFWLTGCGPKFLESIRSNEI